MSPGKGRAVVGPEKFRVPEKPEIGIQMESSIMIIAGEISGDMHAARLVQAIKKLLPDTRFFGIGGPEMRAAGVDTNHDVEDMAVTGLSEVLRRFTFFKNVFNEMVAVARDRKPNAVILVDYPGFNLRFAAKTHQMGIKTIYYICPQVWAWNRGRIPNMARIIDRLITIFPFEKEHFRGTGLQVDFVGHPLVEEARKALDAPETELPWNGAPRIALLPGSRANEIERILPVLWTAAGIIEKKHPGAGFVIAAPSEQVAEIAHAKLSTLSGGPSRHSIVTGKTREVLRQATAAMVASGTATIEAALMLCPMIIAYRVATLTYLMCRLLVKVDNIGMVNIVAGRKICPEFVQGNARPETLAGAIDPLLQDGPERAQMINDLMEVTKSLGSAGAEQRAADIIAEALGAGS